MANRLSAETSPYLRQHADNPVDWWPWSNAAFDEARKTSRPVLLSVGYAACHWCHVMAHESFEDAGIAAVMNENFINIKVDREERPDVDHIYQTALQILGQQGGWPLTMFLTADRKPFWGGTYFPKGAAYGRPGFGDILQQIARIHQEEPEKIDKNCAEITSALQKISAGPAAAGFPPGALDSAAQTLFDARDPENGGFGQTPKFPATSAVELIWRAALRNGEAPYRRHFLRTMERMCRGGIYDHLGGGFARYATDARWLVPHFEKMLYDNALILELLAQAFAATGDDLFQRRAVDTVAWLEREMLMEEGAFAASLDADSAGGEGTYYLWSRDEIDSLLGAESKVFAEQYDVTTSGNFEGRNILNQLLSGPDAESEAALADSRRVLLDARQRRERPGRDDKILADWNGLAVRALARASIAFARPDWLQLAERVFTAICDNLEGAGSFVHSACRGKKGPLAMLDDYAALIGASLALFEANGRKNCLDRAVSWLKRLNSGFWNNDHGGFYATKEGTADLIIRDRPLHDAATPSGNGIMAENLVRLALLTGEHAYREQAEEIFAAFGGYAARAPFAAASLLNAFDAANDSIEVTAIGDSGKALVGMTHPNLVVHRVSAANSLPSGHPAAALGTLPAGSVIICRNQACGLPIQGEAEIRDALAQTGILLPTGAP